MLKPLRGGTNMSSGGKVGIAAHGTCPKYARKIFVKTPAASSPPFGAGDAGAGVRGARLEDSFGGRRHVRQVLSGRGDPRHERVVSGRAERAADVLRALGSQRDDRPAAARPGELRTERPGRARQ